MKILIVSNLFPPIIFGGYEILCQQVVQLLRERGHEVQVLSSSFQAELAPNDPNVHRTLCLTTDFPRPGESVGKVDFSIPTRHRVGKRNGAAGKKVIESFQPDLLFCWCMNRLGAGVVKEALSRNIPVYYSMNDEHPRQFAYVQKPSTFRELARSVAERFFSSATFRNCSEVKMTAISHALKRNLLRLGAPVEKATVIHQGVDLNQFDYQPSHREEEESLKLLYVGQLSRVKGVHTLIQAVSRIELPFHLTLVGTGVPDYLAELHQAVAAMGLQDRVTFTGKLSREKVVEAYHAHHVLCFTSEWDEPFGLTHLEAMACGCAVVSTTTGGSGELIRDRENALAFSAGDATDLARRVEELGGAEKARRELIRRARLFVEEHHDLKRYVDRLEEWLLSTPSSSECSIY